MKLEIEFELGYWEITKDGLVRVTGHIQDYQVTLYFTQEEAKQKGFKLEEMQI